MGIDRIPVVKTPDVAIEIISPSETATTIQRKIEAYLVWGLREIWLFYPATKTLMLHDAAGTRRIGQTGVLASEYFPGWQLQVSELFENL